MNRLRRAAKLVLIVLLPAACDILSPDDDVPANARVVISGEAGASLRLITSNQFEVTSNPETGAPVILLFAGDTTIVSPPFDRTYPLGPHARFFARLTNADTTAASVRMQVFFDAQEYYDHEEVLRADNQMEFSYTFRR